MSRDTTDRDPESPADPSLIPTGEVVTARTVGDLGAPLRTALDRELTGYLVIEPSRSILLDENGRGIVTFEDGVPALAYETSGDVGGSDALAALAGEEPARTELYRLDRATLAPFHERTDCRVASDAPARELAGDDELASRVRERAPADGRVADRAAAAFLADEERVEAIRAEARTEARERAEEWGLTDQLVDES